MVRKSRICPHRKQCPKVGLTSGDAPFCPTSPGRMGWGKEGRGRTLGQKAHLKAAKMSPKSGGAPLACRAAPAWASLPMGQRELGASSERGVPAWEGGTGPTPTHHSKIKICFKKEKKVQVHYTGQVSPHHPVCGRRGRCCTHRRLLNAAPFSPSAPSLSSITSPLPKSFTVIYLNPLLLMPLAEAALDFSGGTRRGSRRVARLCPGGSFSPSLLFLHLFFHSVFRAFSFFLRKKRSPSASKEINPIYYLWLSKCVSLPRDARRIRNSPRTEN